MKKKAVVLLLAAMMAMSMTAGAEETEGVQTEAGQAAEAGALSDKWSDYQIQVDDTVYQFPMLYEEFLGLGWTTDEVEGVELEPYQYGSFRFKKDDVKCSVYILNLGKNTIPASECIVGGMSIDAYDWDVTKGTITLPGGIVRGQADVETIKTAYGTPSDTYEGDLYTELSYETDYNCSVEMQVGKESGVLEDIVIENFVEPEGFDPGEVSTEVPESVTAYVKPQALGTDLTAYEIELDGQVYTLPVPVSVLVADGWELDENDSDPEIAAGYFGWVTLRKGGQEIHETVRNEEKYATIPQNCWMEELTVGGYTLEAEGSLPGGIKQGMTEADFLKVLEDAGMEYSVEESGDYAYYRFNEGESYDQYLQAVICRDEDGHFPQDTVMEISCSHSAR